MTFRRLEMPLRADLIYKAIKEQAKNVLSENSERTIRLLFVFRHLPTMERSIIFIITYGKQKIVCH